MGVTLTSRLELAKQAQSDINWHTALNAGFDSADARLLQSGAGTPIGSITPHYVGQWYHDTTDDFMWHATGATNADWKKAHEMVSAADKAAILLLDETDYMHTLAVAEDTGIVYLCYDPAGGTAYAWTQITKPQSYTTIELASGASVQAAAAATWEDMAGCEITVTLPDDGLVYELAAYAILKFYTNEVPVAVRIVEDIDGAGENEVGEPAVGYNDGTDHNYTRCQEISTEYVNGNLAGDGAEHVFKLQWAANTTSSNARANPSGAIISSFMSATPKSSLKVRLSPYVT